MRALTNNRLRRNVNVPSGRKQLPTQFFDLRGLDQVTPHDVLDDSHSPNLRNARMYARDDESRRVAIRTRKGPGFYSVPVGEEIDTDVDSTTGADDQWVNTVRWVADKFEPTKNGRLTRLDIRIRNDNGAVGNVILRVYEDDDGEPGSVIGISSVPGSDIPDEYDWVQFNFIDAPEMDNSSTYWVSAALQQGGQDNYSWSSTTTGSTGLETNTSGGDWNAINAGLNLRTYIADDGRIRGLHRYYPTSNDNETLFAHGTDLYKVNDSTGEVTSITDDLSVNDGEFRFADAEDKVYMVNRGEGPRVYDGTTIETLDAGLPDCRLAVVHKNRLFLVPTSDPTQIIFSDLGDFDTFEGTAFLYVPSPKNPDPIEGLVSFQDNLIIFTRNSKWVLSGESLANFTLREALGKEGLMNPEAFDITDNYIYFVSNNGFFRWNGSQDEKLSGRVENEFRNIPNRNSVNVVTWENECRVYYRSPSASTNDRCLIYDRDYEEWMLDTDTPIRFTQVLYKDDNLLVEASDRVGALYYAEQDFNILGKPIDFQYWTKYHSFGNSAARKQIRRFYPLLRSRVEPFEITIQVDKDLDNNPIDYHVDTQAEGGIWGEFNWNDGTTYGASALTDPRLSISGQAVYYQFRFIKWGANTPVEILGYMAYPRIRRPK